MKFITDAHLKNHSKVSFKIIFLRLSKTLEQTLFEN